jgi:hypothetical protein
MAPLRELLDRPLAVARWPATLALTGLLVGGAFGLAVLLTPDHRSTPPTANSPVLTSSRRTGASASAAGRRRLREARRVALRFAGDYSARLYGRWEAAQIRGATAHLRNEIEHGVVRTPATRVGLRPRIVFVRVTALSPTEAIATATIADSRSPRYPITFHLAARNGRWRVSALFGE